MVLNGIPISEDECIGDSLATINSAFQSISSAVTQVESNSAFNVFDSPTIDLNWNASTRTLSAAAITSTLSTLLTSSLSGVPMAAKAWAVFDGRGTSTGSQTISASYNISSIARNGTGLFSVNFAQSLPTSNYLVVGNASQSSSSTNNCQVTIHSQNQTGSNTLRNPTTSSFFISVVNNSGVNDQAFVVNVCVF